MAIEYGLRVRLWCVRFTCNSYGPEQLSAKDWGRFNRREARRRDARLDGGVAIPETGRVDQIANLIARSRAVTEARAVPAVASGVSAASRVVEGAEAPALAPTSAPVPGPASTTSALMELSRRRVARGSVGQRGAPSALGSAGGSSRTEI